MTAGARVRLPSGRTGTIRAVTSFGFATFTDQAGAVHVDRLVVVAPPEPAPVRWPVLRMRLEVVRG